MLKSAEKLDQNQDSQKINWKCYRRTRNYQ